MSRPSAPASRRAGLDFPAGAPSSETAPRAKSGRSRACHSGVSSRGGGSGGAAGGQTTGAGGGPGAAGGVAGAGCAAGAGTAGVGPAGVGWGGTSWAGGATPTPGTAPDGGSGTTIAGGTAAGGVPVYVGGAGGTGGGTWDSAGGSGGSSGSSAAALDTSPQTRAIAAVHLMFNSYPGSGETFIFLPKKDPWTSGRRPRWHSGWPCRAGLMADRS
jgi:hypothetical protein